MAYRIRYTGGKGICTRQLHGIPVQILTALALLALVGLVRLCSSEGSALLEAVLACQPGSVTELAVAALANSLAAGEGWYHALAVWCHTVLYGAV